MTAWSAIWSSNASSFQQAAAITSLQKGRAHPLHGCQWRKVHFNGAKCIFRELQSIAKSEALASLIREWTGSSSFLHSAYFRIVACSLHGIQHMMCSTSYVIRYVLCVCVLCVCYGGKKREKKGKNGERERKEREVLFLLSWEERGTIFLMISILNSIDLFYVLCPKFYHTNRGSFICFNHNRKRIVHKMVVA